MFVCVQTIHVMYSVGRSVMKLYVSMGSFCVSQLMMK